MKFNSNDIIETWKLISKEIEKPGKYSRNIYIESKIPIRASVVYENQFKSVDFLFNKNGFNKPNLEFKETKGIKVNFEQDSENNNLIVLSIYLKNNFFLDTYCNLLVKIVSSVHKIEDQNVGINLILNYLMNWRRCFEDEQFEGLSKEEEIGLIGELNFINHCTSKNSNYSQILNCWNGPGKDT